MKKDESLSGNDDDYMQSEKYEESFTELPAEIVSLGLC